LAQQLAQPFLSFLLSLLSTKPVRERPKVEDRMAVAKRYARMTDGANERKTQQSVALEKQCEATL